MNLIPDDIDFSMYYESEEGNHRVLPGSAFTDEVVRHFHDHTLPKGPTLPWKKARNLLRFREAEVTLWNGYNGHGKSEVLGHVILGLAAQQQRVCIASLEMKPVKTLARMCRQASGVRVPSEEYIRDFHQRTDPWIWLYDQQGTVRQDRILALLRYSAKEKKIQHFVIDSLMKCGVPEDGPMAHQAQKDFVEALCTIARDTGMHIHLVVHSRKGKDENTPPGKMDVAGSAGITNQVDNCLNVWRNKPKERAQEKGDSSEANDPDCLLICDKQRNGDWEGRIGLFLHPESHQFMETHFASPVDLLSPTFAEA